MSCVRSVLNQQYPAQLFTCAVIADAFEPATITALQTTGATVHQLPAFENRNKAKAINHYLQEVSEPYDACILLDADNVVHPDFLLKMEMHLQMQHLVVQGKRVAKNENNQLARMDALSEIINNHIFRKGQRTMGFSASLIGSGVMIEMQLFRQLMNGINVYSGFDKELELRLLESRHVIEYDETILISDEKVSNHSVFVNQRRRWIFAQLYFLRRNAVKAFRLLITKGNADYFNKVLQFMLFPRLLGWGFNLLLAIIAFLFRPDLGIFFLIPLVLYSIALYLPVRKTLGTKEFFRLLAHLPKTFIGMCSALFTSGKAAKKFIHTPHNI